MLGNNGNLKKIIEIKEFLCKAQKRYLNETLVNILFNLYFS